MTPETRRRIDFRKALTASVAVTALLVAAPAHAKVGVAAAVNTDARGRPPGAAPRVIALGQNVVFNEEIATDGKGLVQVLLLDGTTFTVGPNSVLTIDEFVYNPATGDAKVVATVAKGAFRFIGGQTSRKAGGATIKTPVGTIGIRGAMVEGNVQSGGSALFSMIFGNEVVFKGIGGGTSRIYQPGYTMVVAGGSSPNVRPRTKDDASSFKQALAGDSAQSGGASDKPDNTTVAQSPVAAVNSNLPATVLIPPDKPPTIQSSKAESPEEQIAELDEVAAQDVNQDIIDEGGGTPPPPETQNGRVLTAPETFTTVDGETLPQAGGRGLVGSTDQTDQVVGFTRSEGRLVSTDGGINLPDYTGTQGDEGLETFAVGDEVVPGGAVSGVAYAGAKDFAAYFLGYGGDPTKPFYLVYGTPTTLASAAARNATTDVREYSLTPDPIRPGTVPFFASDLYGDTAAANTTNFIVIEPNASHPDEWRTYLSFVDIQGAGADQKSAAFVHTSVDAANDGSDSFGGGRRGSFRYAGDAGPANMRGAIGTIGSGGGSHFFGDNAENFVIGSSLDPAETYSDSLLGPGFSGNPNDGYLGDGQFGTHHVGSLVSQRPQAEYLRTSRVRDGYMGGFGESTTLPIGALYGLASGETPNFHLELDAASNSVFATGEVREPYRWRPVVEGFQLTFGAGLGGGGGSAFVDDGMFGATQNTNNENTRLLTEGGQSIANAAGDNPGSYLVSGRANPIAGFTHCASCDFIDWGWWGTRVTIAANGTAEVPETRRDFVHMGTWVAGDITNPDDLPTNMSATFEGTALGNVYDHATDTQYIASGDVDMSFNFGTREGQIAINDFDGLDFHGTLGQRDDEDRALFTGELTGDSVNTGLVAGSFVNDGANKAAGAIGNFLVEGNIADIIGTIAAGRTSLTPNPPPPTDTINARVLLAPDIYTDAFGQPFEVPGERGLVGSTVETDRVAELARSGGRLRSASGDVDLPDLTGSDGNDGLDAIEVSNAVIDGEPASGLAYAGKGNFVAYMLGINGQATQPFYTIIGTATPASAMQAILTGANVREYTLTQDPIRPSDLPFFANDLYGDVHNFNSSNLAIVESHTDNMFATKMLQSWVTIDGEGTAQKSGAFVTATNVARDANDNFRLDGGRRGSFRYAAGAGPANMRGGLGTIAGADDGHFFGPDAENFVVGVIADPADAFHDSLLGPGFSGNQSDGYLGDGSFGTHHVADLVTKTPKAELSRTTREAQGYMAGIGESSVEGVDYPYLLAPDSTSMNFYLRTDAERNSVSARGEVSDVLDSNDVVDSYLLTMGEFGAAGGASAFVDDDRYGALRNSSNENTRLRTDGGQDIPNIAGDNAGSYLVSGRANPIEGFTLCSNCDFIDWGWWGTRVRVAADGGEIAEQRADFVHMGTWVAGDITRVANLPNDITATYEGNVLGSVARQTSVGVQKYIASGDLAISVDFGSRTGSMEISDFDGMNFAAALGGSSDATFAYYSGTLGGNGATGAVVGTFVNDGTDYFSGLIGTFGYELPGVSAVGSFAAVRTGTGALSAQVAGRVLTSPETYTPVGTSEVYSDPGERGLVGSTAATDRLTVFTRQAGRLIGADGDISLPDLTARGEAGVEAVDVVDAVIDEEQSASASGVAYAGKGDFTAYMLGIGGDPTRPFYTIVGTQTANAVMEGIFTTGTNVREYTLTQDPIRPSAVPFFANDLYGDLGEYSSTNFFLVESQTGKTYDAKGYQSWVSIDGQGANQKSAAEIFVPGVNLGADGQYDFTSSRRGTFRYAATAGPANMRGGLGTVDGAGGGGFFGEDANHFVLGAYVSPPDPFSDSLLGPGFTGDPDDGYLGTGYPFSTYHVASLAGKTSKDSLDRTSRQVFGFMTGIAESSADGLLNPYVIAADDAPNFFLDLNADYNSVSAGGVVSDVQNRSPVADSYLITFGWLGETGGDNAFVDNDRFAASRNGNNANTRLMTDGGQDLPNRAGDNPGSYMVSGRANPIEGFQHCTDCAFMDWGWWGTRVRVDASGAEIPNPRNDLVHMGTWVAGDITNPADLPSHLTASYQGTALGNVARNTADGGVAKYIAKGDMNMTYDFNRRAGSMSINNFDGMNLISEVTDRSNSSQALFGGNLSGSGVNGAVSGAFVNDGPNVAAGVIGNFNVSGTGVMATGTIAGAKITP